MRILEVPQTAFLLSHRPQDVEFNREGQCGAPRRQLDALHHQLGAIGAFPLYLHDSHLQTACCPWTLLITQA